jgi:NDMA-dependent alcohol dehydrogenase
MKTRNNCRRNKMKAAICYQFGQPLVIEEIEIDPPKKGEVKVRMVATAICHSDVHAIQGEWGGELPVVAGHEGAGIVEDIGPDVNLVHKGDHVIVSLLRSCGRCEPCTKGAPHLCDGEFALQSECRLHNRQGQSIHHGLKTAAFAEYVVVDQSQLVSVPKDMPLESAALLACGVITGVGAVVNRAQVEPGSSVVVIGAGGVGLNSIQGAHLVGAHPIIAIDLLDNKLEAAYTFGATHALNATKVDIQAAVSEITDGRLADYVFVTVGTTNAAEQAYSITRKRGMVILVGIPDWISAMPVPIGPTVLTEKTITGSMMGTTRLSVDIPWLVALYEVNRLKLDELITARYSLDQINDAIGAMQSGSVLRNVILFD